MPVKSCLLVTGAAYRTASLNAPKVEEFLRSHPEG